MNADGLDGLRVLIVDDEEDFARTLASRLELRGLQAVCAFSGEKGLEALRAGPPDILLLDMRMPGMPGVELLRALRTDNTVRGGAALPVIIVSGHAMTSDMATVQDLGIQGHVAKPVDFSELLESIRHAVRHTRKGDGG